MRTDSSWTPERFERAKALWIAGKSAAEIAKALGGVTRNAVTGKLHRSQKHRHAPASVPGSTPRVTKPRARPAPRPVGAKAAVLSVAPVSAYRARKPAAFEPLPGTAPKEWTERVFGECAWPVSEGLSCCAAIYRRSWCATHFAIGTQPMKPKQTAREYERRFAA